MKVLGQTNIRRIIEDLRSDPRSPLTLVVVHLDSRPVEKIHRSEDQFGCFIFIDLRLISYAKPIGRIFGGELSI